jgi:outer membrane immunogenic protein
MGHSKKASHIAITVALGAGLWASGTVSALAADTTPAAGWSGAYVGLLTGVDAENNDWKASSVGPNNVYGVDAASSKASLDKTGGRLGGYAGWTLPIDAHFVAGVEGDFAGVFGGKKTVSGIPGISYGGLTPDDSISARRDWDASLRARIGYAVDPEFLVYGAGGVAFQDTEYKANCPATSASWCGVPESAGTTTTSVGWTLGAGGEGKLTDALSVRVEYRYAGFERSNLNFFQAANSGGDSFSAKADPSSHVVTLGITYRFGNL